MLGLWDDRSLYILAQPKEAQKKSGPNKQQQN